MINCVESRLRLILQIQPMLMEGIERFRYLWFCKAIVEYRYDDIYCVDAYSYRWSTKH